MPEVLKKADRAAAEGGGSISITDDMDAAFEDADVVYPKSWGNLELFRDESAALAASRRYQDWICDARRMSLAKPEALYMHCLPADITGVSCKEGEVAASVFEKYRLPTYREASHKPFIIAAMIMLTRFEKPGQIIQQLAARRSPRRRPHPRRRKPPPSRTRPCR